MTGRAYALCPVEVRPCPPGMGWSGVPLTPGPGWQPVIDSGVIRNVSTVEVVTCGGHDAIYLPGPVAEVLGWTVDGVDMDLAGLVVHGNQIRRLAGQSWPSQNLSLPSGHVGTWSVRYLRGRTPPPGAAGMVGMLANEFYAAATGGKCRLPRRTSQVQRQGVTVSMVDPSEIFASGSTGLSEVDLWVKAHNPYGLTEETTVWSPDKAVQ